jgi:hypothetical protein
MMELQKVRKCHRIAFMAEGKLSNIAAFKKIPAYAGMTTYTFCELVSYASILNARSVYLNL